MSLSIIFKKALLLVAAAFISANLHPAMADGSVSGTDNNSPLQLQYTFTGGNIDPELINDGGGARHFNATARKGETLSVNGVLLGGHGDGGGIKDWNKISVTITVNGERKVDETVKSSSLPSLKGSYTVAEGDTEIEVNVYGFTEWWHPMGGSNSHLSFTVRYTVVAGEVKSEKKADDGSPSRIFGKKKSGPYNGKLLYEVKDEELLKCHFCGMPDSRIRFNDLFGEVEIACRTEAEYETYEIAEIDSIIYEDDVIRTKEESGAILGLEDMSTFVLKQESKLLIHSEAEEVTKFEMLYGRIVGNVKKMMEGKTMGFEMFQCVSGIKGTLFALEETGTESRAWLFTSKMDVTSKKTGQTISLQPGQMAEVGTDGIIRVEEFNLLETAREFDIKLTDYAGWYITHKPAYTIIAVIALILILVLLKRLFGRRSVKGFARILLLVVVAAVALFLYKRYTADGEGGTEPVQQEQQSQGQTYDIDGIEGIVGIDEEYTESVSEESTVKAYTGTWVSDGVSVFDYTDIDLSKKEVAALIDRNLKSTDAVEFALRRGTVGMWFNGNEKFTGNYALLEDGNISIETTDGDKDTIWMFSPEDGVLYNYIRYTEDDGTEAVTAIKYHRTEE